jgi:hypothetical protein
MFVPLIFVRIEYQVAVNDHAHRKPRSDRQCRLNVEILLNDFLSGLVEAIAGSTAERGDDIAIAASTVPKPVRLLGVSLSALLGEDEAEPHGLPI